jgi:hypothetical protein
MVLASSACDSIVDLKSGRATAFAACTADDSRGHRTHGAAAGPHSSPDKTSGNLWAACECAGLLEIDAIADRRTHFTLRRALHFETTSNAVCVGTRCGEPR